ncbi:MFS transporter [Paraburkholderia aspalathi]|uniref:MFS transporter n=1 Tax=Paraburkholderia aspalathi TaxID=1324617 RepID=UPI003C84AC8A
MKSSTTLDYSGLVAKVSRRLKWVLLTVMFIGFMDRQNLGFVAPYMKSDLNITATQIGIGASLFFVGYLLFEVPSNLLMARFGPRIWLARIMITWGLVSCLGAFVSGTQSFYAFRLFLGIAEAGLIPGVMLYLSFWIPRTDIGKFSAWALFIGPLSGSITAVVTAALLSMNGIMNLAGWQWAFLVEGVPAVIFGVLLFRILTDYPEKATWLAPDERQQLTTLCTPEQADRHTSQKLSSVAVALRNPAVYLLGGLYFLLNVPLASTTWIPLSLHASGQSGMTEGLLAAVPSAAASLVIIPWASRSDRRAERYWHLLLPTAVSAFGWGLAAIYSRDVALITIATSIGYAGTYAALGVFWTLPSLLVPDCTRPASIALITAMGLPGSMLALMGGGKLLEASRSFFGCYILAAVAMALMVVLVILGLWNRRRVQTREILSEPRSAT